jgi:hypothetical protein
LKNSIEVRVPTVTVPIVLYPKLRTGKQSTRREIKSNRGELRFISVETVIDRVDNRKQKIYYRPVLGTGNRPVLDPSNNRPVLDTSRENIVKIFHTSGQNDFPGWGSSIPSPAIWDYSEDGKVSIYYFTNRPNTKEREIKRDQNQRDCFYKKKEIYDLESGFLLYEAEVDSFGYDTKGYCIDYILKETANNYGGPGERDEIIVKFFKGTGESSIEITEDDYNNIKNHEEEKPQPQYQEPQPRYQQPQPQQPQPQEPQPQEPQPQESQPQESQPQESQPQESQPQESQPQESQESQPQEELADVNVSRKSACYFVINKFNNEDKNISIKDIDGPLTEKAFINSIQKKSIFKNPYVIIWDLANLNIIKDGRIAIISSAAHDALTDFVFDGDSIEYIKRECGN